MIPPANNDHQKV